MPLLIFATLGEAQATLHALEARPATQDTVEVWSEGFVPALFEAPPYQIAISGFGAYGALRTLMRYGTQHEHIWNLGLAGTLNEALPLGEICIVSQVSKYLPLPPKIDPLSRDIAESSLPAFSIAPRGVRLVTTDFPVHDATLRDQLSAHFDLVDMEGYGIAYGAHHLGKKCHLWKVISDPVSPHGRALLENNKSALSALLAEKILESNPLAL